MTGEQAAEDGLNINVETQEAVSTMNAPPRVQETQQAAQVRAARLPLNPILTSQSRDNGYKGYYGKALMNT
eukprot:657199-Prorocentrum_minimum.AAC.1